MIGFGSLFQLYYNDPHSMCMNLTYPLCHTPLSAFANRLYQDIFLKYHLQKGREVQFIPQWQQYSSDIENEISQQLGQTNSSNDRFVSGYQKVRPKIVRELASVR